MDKKKRGDVELMIDDAIRREGAFSDSIRWVQQIIPISSLDDLAIGYTIGVIETFAVIIAAMPSILSPKVLWDVESEDSRTIRAITRRRLLEIAEKIHGELNR